MSTFQMSRHLKSRRRFLLSVVACAGVASCQLSPWKPIIIWSESFGSFLKDTNSSGYQYVGERVLRLAALSMVTYPFLGGLGWLTVSGPTFRYFELFDPRYGIITIDDWLLSTPDELAKYANLTFLTAERFAAEDMTVGPDDELISEHARVGRLAHFVRRILQRKEFANISYFPVIAISREDMDRLLQRVCEEVVHAWKVDISGEIDEFEEAVVATDYKKVQAVISALFPEFRCTTLDQLPFLDERSDARFLETP